MYVRKYIYFTYRTAHAQVYNRIGVLAQDSNKSHNFCLSTRATYARVVECT